MEKVYTREKYQQQKTPPIIWLTDVSHLCCWSQTEAQLESRKKDTTSLHCWGSSRSCSMCWIKPTKDLHILATNEHWIRCTQDMRVWLALCWHVLSMRSSTTTAPEHAHTYSAVLGATNTCGTYEYGCTQMFIYIHELKFYENSCSCSRSGHPFPCSTGLIPWC